MGFALPLLVWRADIREEEDPKRVLAAAFEAMLRSMTSFRGRAGTSVSTEKSTSTALTITIVHAEEQHQHGRSQTIFMLQAGASSRRSGVSG